MRAEHVKPILSNLAEKVAGTPSDVLHGLQGDGICTFMSKGLTASAQGDPMYFSLYVSP